jgi:acetyl-CoA synthetase
MDAGVPVDGGKAFIELRDRLLCDGISHEQALDAFRWPAVGSFNWAVDYFDRIAKYNDSTALRVVHDTGTDQVLSYAALARRSDQVAAFLAAQGVRAGDRLLLMLGNVVPLWETMLAAMKLGAVIIPATTLLQRADLEDRLARGRVRAIVTDRACTGHFAGLPGASIRIAVGGSAPGWADFADSEAADPKPVSRAPTPADSLLLLI